MNCFPPGPPEKQSISELRRNPLQSLFHYTSIYGDIVMYKTGDWRVVILNDPLFIRHILQDNFHNYIKTGTPDLMMLKPLLGNGLMTSEGEPWITQRRLVQPSFHRERIESFAGIITASTQQMLENWQNYSKNSTPIDVSSEMSGLTLGIIAKILFSSDINSNLLEFSRSVNTMNKFISSHDSADSHLFEDFKNSMATMHILVSEIIAERKRTAVIHDDLLAMLFAAYGEESSENLPSQQLKDQVFTLLMAGHETTAQALTWCLYLLHLNPDIASNVYCEVSTFEAVKRQVTEVTNCLPYTWMVIQEAMRLYPPVWSMTRLCKAEDVIGGYIIPKDSIVLISPYLMHRHPRLWNDPERFDPLRFHSDQIKSRPEYSYFPFSGGPRQCIGRSLAQAEVLLILASIIKQYSFSLVKGHLVIPEALVTLRPSGGMPMILHKRSSP